ncbi:uncharacterized protein N7511_007186 [Penicillium nucicola]|uniref:uncharacterized protein n=1 Tax=Penicillium nucicola TaxID=1850975 RepID=UPI002544F70C|nr:uncharacterized protein N7511_007186 [Penicillium nucicola]KAJ5757004.1 hypothetical protein N7511_007186 [Penicillium nucicola]
MSIDVQPGGVSASNSNSPSTSPSTSTPPKPTAPKQEPQPQPQNPSPNPSLNPTPTPTPPPSTVTTTATTLLTTLLSPFTKHPQPPPPPEAYYTPTEIPLFKRLQKTRLSRTREKQLLRAAERAFDDPPPQPAPGDCCGSSCDPCVRDLWGEEIGVWRGRWGDRAVEGGKEKEIVEGDGSGSGKVNGNGNGNGNKGRKDLEW